MRINILYLLDNLCESSLMHQSQVGVAGGSQGGSYVQYVTRDLHKIVQLVVPDTRDGLVNLLSTRQVMIHHLHQYCLPANLISPKDTRKLALKTTIGPYDR